MVTTPRSGSFFLVRPLMMILPSLISRLSIFRISSATLGSLENSTVAFFSGPRTPWASGSPFTSSDSTMMLSMPSLRLILQLDLSVEVAASEHADADLLEHVAEFIQGDAELPRERLTVDGQVDLPLPVRVLLDECVDLVGGQDQRLGGLARILGLLEGLDSFLERRRAASGNSTLGNLARCGGRVLLHKPDERAIGHVGEDAHSDHEQQSQAAADETAVEEATTLSAWLFIGSCSEG